MLGTAIPSGILTGGAAAAWSLNLGTGWTVMLLAYSAAGAIALLFVAATHRAKPD